MAVIQCNFLSKSLVGQTNITVLIPTLDYAGMVTNHDPYVPGRKFQTLYLLHGMTGDNRDWLYNTCISPLAQANQLAVVMPAAGNSFYTDMAHGGQYWTYINEELPKVARALFPLSDRREDNFVAGLSMGGYGALKLAFRHPAKFAAAASLSGAVDIVADRKKTLANFEDIFGNIEKIGGSDHDLFYLAEQLKKSGATLPKIFQACGTEDFLYKDNLKFRDHLQRLGINHTYMEGTGDHSWDFWDSYIKKVIAWLPLKRQPI